MDQLQFLAVFHLRAVVGVHGIVVRPIMDAQVVQAEVARPMDGLVPALPMVVQGIHPQHPHLRGIEVVD